MARTKKKTIKKVVATNQKQAINIMINSNNRRKVATKSAPQQQPIYIPSSSQATPTIVLSHQPQAHPATNTDVSSHVEALVKKYTAPERTLLHKSEPDKSLIETAKEPVKADVPGVAVKVEPETHLTSHPRRRARFLMEPRDVPNSSDSEYEHWSPGGSVSAGSHKSFIKESDSDTTKPPLTRVQALSQVIENNIQKNKAPSSIAPKQTVDASSSPLRINLPQIRAYLKNVERMTDAEVRRIGHAEKERYLTHEYKQKISNYFENLKE